jgi:hypothetical protein
MLDISVEYVILQLILNRKDLKRFYGQVDWMSRGKDSNRVTTEEVLE